MKRHHDTCGQCDNLVNTYRRNGCFVGKCDILARNKKSRLLGHHIRSIHAPACSDFNKPRKRRANPKNKQFTHIGTLFEEILAGLPPDVLEQHRRNLEEV